MACLPLDTHCISDVYGDSVKWYSVQSAAAALTYLVAYKYLFSHLCQNVSQLDGSYMLGDMTKIDKRFPFDELNRAVKPDAENKEAGEAEDAEDDKDNKDGSDDQVDDDYDSLEGDVSDDDDDDGEDSDALGSDDEDDDDEYNKDDDDEDDEDDDEDDEESLEQGRNQSPFKGRGEKK